MSRWWSSGATAVDRIKLHDEHNKSDHPFRRVALVVGSTGIVGTSLVEILPLHDTPGGPWKVYALSRRHPPPWSPPPSPSVVHIHVDLADTRAVAEALTPLTDITHLFYVTWSPHATEAMNRDANSAMFRHVLSVVVTSCPSLTHVCLQTGTKHYIGPFELIGKVPAPEPPYTEDMPRLLDCPNFYYDQEDILFNEVSKCGGNVSWSVHRPSVIFGFSPRSVFNTVGSLCVYAAICRKEGGTLRWPGSLGSWDEFVNASDADLIAEQEIWAAVDPTARNQAFNCCNGDIYKWKQLWPVLADRFGLEWAGYAGEEGRFSVVESMAGKEEVWAEIVEENGLVETKLCEVANWWLVDVVVNEHGANWKLLDSMNKSKEYGFFGFRNTVKSFHAWIDKMKAYKIVP